MKIRVLKSTHEYWYSVLIGHEVEVRECNDTWWFSVQHKNLILKSDSVVIDNFILSDFVNSKMEEINFLNPSEEMRDFVKNSLLQLSEKLSK